jgi:hypothetical protein
MIPSMARVETSTMAVRLFEAVDYAMDYLERLRPLLAEPEGRGPQTGTIGRSAPESREPWAQQAASAYWDLWFGARSVVIAMRAGAGHKYRDEPGGPEALMIIRNLAPGATELILRGSTRSMERWVRAAGAVPAMDEAEPWEPLPQHGGRALSCPYCRTFSLRMLKLKGEVRCFFPGCTDSDGHATVARMERGRLSGDGILIFGDGTTMGGQA